LKFRETQEKQTPNREQLIPSNLTINLAFINDFAASGAIGNALRAPQVPAAAGRSSKACIAKPAPLVRQRRTLLEGRQARSSIAALLLHYRR